MNKTYLVMRKEVKNMWFPMAFFHHFETRLESGLNYQVKVDSKQYFWHFFNGENPPN